MVNIFLFTQNVKLESFEKFKNLGEKAEENIFLTTHLLFDNERTYLESLFQNCRYMKFADFLSDAEMQACDENAYSEEMQSTEEYYGMIKRLKNNLIITKVLDKFEDMKGYICSDDLGIDEKLWVDAGFERLECEYYYVPVKKTVTPPPKEVGAQEPKRPRFKEVYAAEWNGKKYIFIGSLNRIGYRLDLKFEESDYERERLNNGEFYSSEQCQYLTTIHEIHKCRVPDEPQYDVRCIQDGYLPPNYSGKYLKIKPENLNYYAWDALGEEIFKKQNIPISLLPFRKKLYIPEPNFPKEIKTVLITTSGSGDWTAQKNRSDDDLMVIAFVEMAKRFPDIEFIYRCHPVWVHPRHTGVNSINRVAEYLSYTGLNNIHLSGNILANNLNAFMLSIPRTSFQEDLQKADIVFGEHSISMIDAAFENIPFASINLTNRRDLFCGISDMGFPLCSTVDDIEAVIHNIEKPDFQKDYVEAVKRYNAMTAQED